MIVFFLLEFQTLVPKSNLILLVDVKMEDWNNIVTIILLDY